MNKLQYFFHFSIFIGILVVIDIAILNFFFIKEQELFYWNTYQTILLFVSFSFVICATSFYFYKKNFDVMGYVFLGTTMLKMFLLFIIAKPLLLSNATFAFEKNHFFVLFFLFLIVETYLTILLLKKV